MFNPRLYMTHRLAPKCLVMERRASPPGPRTAEAPVLPLEAENFRFGSNISAKLCRRLEYS
jgi:hypothetical protein